MITDGRQARFVDFERRRLAKLPRLAVGQRWDWDDADHHQVEVLELEPPGPGAEFPWPRVTCRFASGTVVTVGATAFVGATPAVVR
jgi:hypothetical protein